MVEREIRLEEARQRALIISDRIRERSDLAARRIIEGFATPLAYENQLEALQLRSPTKTNWKLSPSRPKRGSTS